jgi:hypothetical protein
MDLAATMEVAKSCHEIQVFGEGAPALDGARDTPASDPDPCAPQPRTINAATSIQGSV